MANKIVYSEPEDYIPKDIRKKYQLGEFDPEFIARQNARKEQADREKLNNDLRNYVEKGK